MKKHFLLFTLLLALMVPMAAVAQVERTVTVYNGKDTECHVPLYGNVTRMDDLSYSQFIMDKSVLQAAGLAGKEISKMTLHLANSVPDSYEWTTKRRTIVTLAEVDASELDGGFIQNMTNPTNVFADYLDAHGETMEIIFGTPFTYSGEQNLLVQFREEYMYYFNYHPFASYRLPMYYGVYKTGASYWRQVRASNNYSTVSSLNCHFVPKTTFTYLTEANWANTKAPKNAITQSGYSTGNNNSISYYIRMDWDASDNYTGSYQVLCVPRGTSSLNWSTAATTNETFYSFGGLEKNTAYDLYVRAKSGLFFTSNAAMASASTPFYPANLDEGPLTFDFNSQTMPNGLDFDCSTPRYLSAYGSLNYCNLGTTYNGATAYNNTPPITITLPELKFTNATNGLMLDFDLKGKGVSVYDLNTAELQVKIIDRSDNQVVFSQTVSASNQQHFTFRLPELTTSNYHLYTLSFSYAGGTGFGLDNIVVRKAPNIMPPYNLSASEITPTSAEISWTDDNTNSHTIDLVYRQKGYSNDPNVWEHYVEGVTNPYTLTGLTPYTDYEVKVKTITSSAYEDSEILEFSTLCTPAEVPYNEPFTGLTTLPTDWRVNVPEYAEVVTEIDNGRLTMHNTVTEVTEYYYGYPFTHTLYSDFSAYIILPYFNNLGSLQLSFKAGRTQGALESLQVGVVADPKNYVSFTQIGTATLTDNANGEVYSFNLVNNAVQNGHIVIRLYNSDDVVQSIWLDDFSVQQYAAPTNLEVLTTNNSASLSWNAGAATEWEVRYKATSASSYGTPFAVTEPACTITGLTTNTEYTAQVRAKYGDGLYSTWEDGDFGTFKTLMQEAVVMNALNTSYLEDFQSSNGNWLFIDGGGEVNRWRRFSYFNMNYGNLGYGLRVTYSADNSATTQWKYRTLKEGTIANVETPATSYAVKTFTLSAGHYEFGYDYAVKGRANDDYMRVVLVPAETVFEAGVLPEGFDYNNTPNAWFSLDGGQQLTGNSSNSDYYGWNAQSPISLDVYPGGTYEPGNYMIVVLWKNEGSSRFDLAQNPPGAIDNVSVTWSSLVYPPAVAALHDQVTDTEAPLALYASEQGITPTSYEVQYEPAAAVNTYEGAPIATFNVTETPQTVTLTGLTPLTIYSARVRSVYTANGHSVYSDWQGCPSLFTTLCTPPTNLVVVGQTSSWANVRWNPVEMTLPDGQYINYCVQLTTDPDDWGDEDCGWASDSWEKNLAPGTYHFRVRTIVYEGSSNMGGSDWSDPITFTIAPWTEPVTIFPLTYDFEEWSNHFADGLTLDGDYENLDILTYGVSDVPAPEEGENEYALQFRSTANKTACLVLPPLRPSTSSALVSFWWYHDSSDNYVGEGVVVEYSSDGSSWTSFGDVIPRYADQTGWVKYQKVVPTVGPDADYIRLRFIGSSSNQWSRYCYLDDLTVNAFESQQPYISYVGCDAYTADITLYDYAYDNGWPSSDFQVQYRKVGNEWSDNSIVTIANTEPAFQKYLTVENLDPNTYYEFRARARVSIGNTPLAWSNYSESYRQWTSNGVFTVSPGHSFEMDFEYGAYNWTLDPETDRWDVQHDGAYQGSYCAYCPGRTSLTDQAYLTSPEINFSGCDNVILRFWSKGKGIIRVYYGENFEQYGDICTLSATDDWEEVELSLSYFLNKGPVKVSFYRKYNNTSAWYVDDISIIANVYDKIFDCKWNEVGLLSSGINWYPSGVPSATDEVMIMASSQVYYSSSPFSCGTINFGTKGSVWVRENCLLTVTNFNATKKLTIDGTANITTLNPGFANSVVVNDGGVLNATTITTANAGENDRVVIKDGGQVKTENTFYATIEKDITGYGAENVNNHTGYYLVAPTTEVMAVPTFVPQINSQYQFDQMDFYWFNGNQELEWYNPKCPAEGGCESLWGTILQGQFSAEVAQPLHGYLYALQEDGTLQFAAGSVGNTPFSATNVDTSVDLVFYSNSDAPFNGWNLIGNPYTCNAYLLDENGEIMPFYRMNETGDTIVPAQAGTAIKPCEGVFVVCPSDGQSHQAVFTTTVPATVGEAQDSPMVTVPVHALLGNQEAYLILRQLAELAEGWNWWAPTVQMSVADLQDALGDLEAIISKDGELTDDEDVLSPGQMYKLQTSDDCSLNVLGIVVPNASVTIESGYNWFGCTVETDIDDLGVTPATGDKIISQDNGFAIFNGTEWEGTLETLVPGKGYVYFRNTSGD